MNKPLMNTNELRSKLHTNHRCSSVLIRGSLILKAKLNTPRTIDSGVANLLDDTISVAHHQYINHYKLVTLALEALAHSSSHRHLFAVSNRAPIDQITRGVNPRTKLDVAHQQLI